MAVLEKWLLVILGFLVCGGQLSFGQRRGGPAPVGYTRTPENKRPWNTPQVVEQRQTPIRYRPTARPSFYGGYRPRGTLPKRRYRPNRNRYEATVKSIREFGDKLTTPMISEQHQRTTPSTTSEQRHLRTPSTISEQQHLTTLSTSSAQHQLTTSSMTSENPQQTTPSTTSEQPQVTTPSTTSENSQQETVHYQQTTTSHPEILKSESTPSHPGLPKENKTNIGFLKNNESLSYTSRPHRNGTLTQTLSESNHGPLQKNNTLRNITHTKTFDQTENVTSDEVFGQKLNASTTDQYSKYGEDPLETTVGQGNNQSKEKYTPGENATLDQAVEETEKANETFPVTANAALHNRSSVANNNRKSSRPYRWQQRYQGHLQSTRRPWRTPTKRRPIRRKVLISKRILKQNESGLLQEESSPMKSVEDVTTSHTEETSAIEILKNADTLNPQQTMVVTETRPIQNYSPEMPENVETIKRNETIQAETVVNATIAQQKANHTEEPTVSIQTEQNHSSIDGGSTAEASEVETTKDEVKFRYSQSEQNPLRNDEISAVQESEIENNLAKEQTDSKGKDEMSNPHTPEDDQVKGILHGLPDFLRSSVMVDRRSLNTQEQPTIQTGYGSVVYQKRYKNLDFIGR